MVARKRPFWSNMSASEAWVCIVGLLVIISLSGLHSCVEVVNSKWWVYVFFIFCLCIVEVVVICLGGLLFMGGGVVSCC